MKQQHNNRHPPCGCHGEDERLTEIKFVGIEFDQRKIPSQESELNRCIQSDYHILERVQTATGLVFMLGKFGYTSPLPKIEGDDYCFPEISGEGVDHLDQVASDLKPPKNVTVNLRRQTGSNSKGVQK